MVDIRRKPSFTGREIKKIVLEYYGLEVTSDDLAGERDQNIRLTDSIGNHYILKISNPTENRRYLEMESSMLDHIAQADPTLPVPKLLRSRFGQSMEEVSLESDQAYYVRLFTFLSGSPMAEWRPFKTATLSDLGKLLARLDITMSDQWHPIFRRSFNWSIYKASEVLPRYLHYVSNNAKKALIENFLNRFEAFTMRSLTVFQNGIIHNDPNDYNILLSDELDRTPTISGIIDFGDLCFAPYIYEPAIAAAYAILDSDDPIDVAGTILAGYHEVFPRSQAEILSYFDLIAIRLCTTAVMAAFQSAQMPDNRYLKISEKPAWNALEKLVALEPRRVGDFLLARCGLGGDGTARAGFEIKQQRKRFVANSLSLSYSRPINVVRGFRQYLYDNHGRAYLDMVNNVAHVGHCHPKVVRAGQEQMSVLNTNTRYLHAKLVDYAEKLTRTFPDPLEICIFVCSGSEANELALRMASTHTAQENVIVLDGAYHGNSSNLINISPYKFNGPGGKGAPAFVHVARLPDIFRGPYTAEDAKAGERYAEDIQVHIDYIQAQGAGLSAFIHESIPGCAGQIVLPDGYLSAAYERVREAGGVCIADEVQVGFGRIGSHFWAFELQGVVPDIVTLGKPMGNGHPIAAVITTREIAHSFDNGMEYFNTYGGNPVSCAIGLSVLEVIEEESLQKNAAFAGALLLTGLAKLKDQYSIIGDIRGLGLFIGIELVKDRAKQTPAVDEAAWIVELMKERGILLSVDGLYHNVLKIKPPLVITQADITRFISELDDVLKYLQSNPPSN